MLLIGSPPWNSLDENLVEDRNKERVSNHMKNVSNIYSEQHKHCRSFIHEHMVGARTWSGTSIAQLVGTGGVHVLEGRQGNQNRSRWSTNNLAVNEEMMRNGGDGGHDRAHGALHQRKLITNF